MFKNVYKPVTRVLMIMLSLLLFATVLVWDASVGYTEAPEEPVPTETPQPTEVPEPSSDPQPSEQPKPSATPRPSAETITENQPETLLEDGVVLFEDGHPCVQGEVIVVFNKKVKESAAMNALEKVDAGEAEPVKDRIQLVDVPEDISLSDFIDDLEALPEVAYAQPNYLYYLENEGSPVVIDPEDISTSGPEAVTNDPLLSLQWHLDKIQAGNVWDVTYGDALSVRVAVIDTGVQADHPDLSGQIAAQADMVTGDGVADDDNGHGTHVAGIIAAKGNNGEGVVGVAPDIHLIAVDVFSESDGKWTATTANIISGVEFAVDNGARVINLSLGSYSEDTAENDAINAAAASGVLVVASAGNESTNAAHYPSDIDSVLGVIATDMNDTIASYSNYGAAKDISAPGGSVTSTVNSRILSTYKGGQYAWMAGTSMASPVVAGAAALIWSVDPSLTADEVKSLICETAVDIGAVGRDNYYGYGRINVKAAMLMEMKPEGSTSGDYEYIINDGGATATITGYHGAGSEVMTVPDAIDGYPVTGIGPLAYYNIPELVTVSIPESITDIGQSAFAYCGKLKAVIFSGNAPDSVSSDAFEFTGSSLCFYYYPEKDGWSEPTWGGYAAKAIYLEAPSTSASSPAFDRITVTWSAVPNADGYEVYQSTQKNGTYSVVYTVSSGGTISYTRTGLKYDKTYYYKVKAFVKAGAVNIYSNESPVCSAATALGAPSISLAATSYTSIRISWNTVGGATGYEVWYSTKKYGTYSLKYASNSGAAGSWTKNGLTTDKTYYFKTRAFRLVNGVKVYGPDSTIQSTAPGRPSIVVARTSSTSAKISWIAVSGSAGYEVWRSTQKNGTYALKYTASSSATSWKNNSLTTGKAYYYKVRAYRMVSGNKVYGTFSPINSVVP